MAVVPDRRLAIQHKLKMLRTNKQIVLDALQHLLKIKEKSNLSAGVEVIGGIKSENSGTSESSELDTKVSLIWMISRWFSFIVCY